MIRAIAALTLCLALLPLTTSAKDRVYRWTDSKGVVHYSQTQPDKIKSQAKDVRTGKASAPGKPIVVPKTADQLACERAQINADILAGPQQVQLDKDGDGKPETLTTAERTDAKAMNARLVGAYCKGS